MKRRAFKLATAALGGAATVGLMGVGPAHAAGTTTLFLNPNNGQVIATAPDGSTNTLKVENGVVKSSAPLNNLGYCANLGFVAADGLYEADCYHPTLGLAANFWTINGGNATDLITVNGFHAGDTVYVDGGPGADTINALNGRLDNVDCGEQRADPSKDDVAKDTVYVDQNVDKVTHCTANFDTKKFSLK